MKSACRGQRGADSLTSQTDLRTKTHYVSHSAAPPCTEPMNLWPLPCWMWDRSMAGRSLMPWHQIEFEGVCLFINHFSCWMSSVFLERQDGTWIGLTAMKKRCFWATWAQDSEAERMFTLLLYRNRELIRLEGDIPGIFCRILWYVSIAVVEVMMGAWGQLR